MDRGVTRPLPRAADSPEAADEVHWANRRSDARYDVAVRVDLASDANFYRGFTENMSGGGLFVRTFHRLARGTEVTLRLHLDDGEDPIDVACEVCWIRDTDDDGGGMGLRFVDLSVPARARIEEFLVHREPIFYDD
jgi:uncharacterized protein (TIGR02266 family)